MVGSIIHVILSEVKNLAFEESSGQILHFAQNDSAPHLSVSRMMRRSGDRQRRRKDAASRALG